VRVCAQRGSESGERKRQAFDAGVKGDVPLARDQPVAGRLRSRSVAAHSSTSVGSWSTTGLHRDRLVEPRTERIKASAGLSHHRRAA
jgi:hypothetical protein